MYRWELLEKKECARSMAEHSCLMVVPVFPPRNTAGIFRTLRFCRYLPRFGWIPSVCTMNSTDSRDSDPEVFGLNPKSIILRMGACSPVSFGETKSINERANTSSMRQGAGIRGFRALLRPYRELLFETPDKYIGWANLVKRNSQLILDKVFPELIYSSGPPHSTHLAAMHIAKKSGLPWIADFRDPWARLPWDVDRNPLGRKFIPRMEREVIQTAALVILNNDSSRADFCEAYPNYTNKFEAIPNGIDPVTKNQIEEILKLHNREARNGPVTICHAGNLYGQRNPIAFLKAIAQLRRSGTQVRFRQIGPVDASFKAQELVNSLGIEDSITFEPSVPHNQALEAMAKSDILLIIQPDASVMVPAKLFEMMVFKKPIIGVCDSPSTEQIIADYGGFSAPSRDVEKIQSVIRHGIGQLEVDPEMQQKRIATCERFDGVRLAGVLAGHMDRLVCQAN